MKIIINLMLTCYLAIAPVYWLPGISPALLAVVKMILFVGALSLLLLSALASSRFAMPRGVVGPLGLFLCLASIAGGLLQSGLDLALYALKDYLLVFSTLWAFFLLAMTGERVDRLLVGASLVVAALSVPVWLSRYVAVFDMAGPAEFVASHLWVSGFGSVRTGWSNGIAMYVAPLLLVAGGGSTWKGFLPRLVAAAGVISILLSQITVAGRAGMLASMVILIVALSGRGTRVYLACALLAGCLYIVSNMDAVLEVLRITRAETSTRGADDLDTIAAGRLAGNLVGI